ncbi:PREDICTED: anthranilate N-benzoyltransferase protein 1 [Theobroma cacao]|uniref:Anthranilate N-benzoyltransferase protein 1 n=2 Tax=Theobroma cacao TaxID=3641 RepID=A0AB32VEY7_THECC|nr:PREDICTED: anthranilate N-benzoyltransferase protein 1 [Theobroma cacao]EOY25405.1 HXXXD-type acyl-transferase family protein [Theobroma cacao]
MLIASSALPTDQMEVNFTKKSIVKAFNLLPERHHKLITLSNLDLLSGRFPVTYLYFYHRPSINNLSSTVESLKSSLAETLSYYYPFAGRITEDPDTSEPIIICDNTGALLVEAQANIPLRKLDLYNINDSLQGKLVSTDPNFPLQVQVTHYTCGGVSMTFTFDHALGDASAFGNFLSSWSQVARKMPLSCIPDHGRNLRPRLPPTYRPCLDQTFVKCTLEEIRNIPKTNILLKRLYYVDASSINKLQSLACADGNKRTKIEAFSAYIWKVMVTTIDKSHAKCKMGWLVDGRGRLNGSMSNYIGNVLSVAIEEASIVEIKQGSISEIANNVHEAISKVANEEHFLDLIDWIECHKPGLMLPKVVLGRGGPALVLSSGRRFPVAELDFGFGSPVLGTVSSIIEKSGVGYMNQRPSARSDGSWIVSAIIWPELAAALESDSVFQPLCASHLQI